MTWRSCFKHQHVHLLLAVSAAGPVTPHRHRSHRHQEDDHHVVVQHGLVGSVHGDQPPFTKRLWELQTEPGEDSSITPSQECVWLPGIEIKNQNKRCCLSSHLADIQHVRVAEQRYRNINLLILTFVPCWWGLKTIKLIRHWTNVQYFQMYLWN